MDAARATRTAALLERMGRGKTVFRDVVWPGSTTGALVRLRIPTEENRQLSQSEAVRRFERIGLSPESVIHGEQFFNEVALQFLWQIMEDPTRPIIGDPLGRCELWFEDADQARETTTHEEISSLWNEAADLVRVSDPDFPANTSADDTIAIIEAIKKKDATRLRQFGTATLANYLLSTESLPAT